MKKKTIVALVLLFLGIVLSGSVFVYQFKEEVFNWKFYTSFLGILIFGILFLSFLRLAIVRGKCDDKLI
ncbi:hypothetical protein ACT3CE_15095 [Marinifilum sp. RC60d5]|uniref:hypothetical protein n=1 Tax=Marinifilum sp. RC60d5 TaxID=3458414 RepID=UPI0040366990